MRTFQTVLPFHPRTGLRAVGVIAGRPVWPILGGDESDDAAKAAADKAAADAAAKAASDAAAAAAASYTAPASQADLDRIVEQRLARERAKFSDYDELKDAKKRLDEMELELGSDKDKAVAKAREEERAALQSTSQPQLVRLAFKAEAKGVLTQDQLDAVLEDFNPKNYLDDKGNVDEDKIAARVKKFAAAENGGSGNGRHIGLGQGNRPPAASKPGDQGRAMAEKRFGGGDKK